MNARPVGTRAPRSRRAKGTSPPSITGGVLGLASVMLLGAAFGSAPATPPPT